MKGIGKKRVKDGPIRKADSTEIPRRKYYRPAADAKTYRMNGQGQLQCQQDPKDVTRVGTVKELPLCREKPIFHEPVGALIKDKEQLTASTRTLLTELAVWWRIHHQDRPQRRTCTAGKTQGANWEQRSHLCGPGQHDRRRHPWATERTNSWLIMPRIQWSRQGEVRPCLDCIPLNKAIIRENHTPPTVEEIAHELAGARYFTKGDAYKAFLHVHLSKKSRELTVFGTNTHGRLRYKRMAFRMKMSQDVFQIQMDRILEQCPGVIGIHDDVISTDTRGRPWLELINFLNVCQMEGLYLSSKKLELRRDRVSFFGAIYSREGVHPDPKKVQGIEEMTAPETKQQLQSFLGMVTYLGNFIPHLSHHTEPLRQLLKKDVTFTGTTSLHGPFRKSSTF